MYEVHDDVYCYPGTSVLKNKMNIRNQGELDTFELAMTTQRFDEPLPNGHFGARHYCAVHRHLFQDVYSWAGRLRSVRVSKDGSTFCFPERIRPELHLAFGDLHSKNNLCGLQGAEFAAAAAHFLAELNAIHAFRDGNGRVQLAFLQLIATRAGFPLQFEQLRPGPFLNAMIASFHGDERPLEKELISLV